MAYADDLAALERLAKYRLIAFIVAGLLLILSFFLENSRWLDIPRALAWAVAGLIAIQEGRITKRLGRDADFCWLRAIAMFVVATLCVLKGW